MSYILSSVSNNIIHRRIDHSFTHVQLIRIVEMEVSVIIAESDVQTLHEHACNELHAQYHGIEGSFPCLHDIPVFDFCLTDMKQKQQIVVTHAMIRCSPAAVMKYRSYISLRPIIYDRSHPTIISSSSTRLTIGSAAAPAVAVAIDEEDRSRTQRELLRFFDSADSQQQPLVLLSSDVMMCDSTVLCVAASQVATSDDYDVIAVYTRTAIPFHQTQHGILVLDEALGDEVKTVLSIKIESSSSDASESGATDDETAVAAAYPIALVISRQAVVAHKDMLIDVLASDGAPSRNPKILAAVLSRLIGGGREVRIGALPVESDSRDSKRRGAAITNSSSSCCCCIVDAQIESSIVAAEAAASAYIQLQLRGLPDSAADSCCARIGLIGNPSDGFGGKTVSFLIQNFAASVQIDSRPRSAGIEIAEPVFFSGAHELLSQSTKIVRAAPLYATMMPSLSSLVLHSLYLC